MTTVLTRATSAFDIFQTAMEIIFSSENAQDLCRNISHSDLLSGVVRGAYVYSLNTRSNLVETAGYGEPFADGLSEISAWDENAASASVRSKSTTFALGDAKTGRAAVLSIPLVRGQVPTGALVLVLKPDTAESPIDPQVAPALSKLAAYFIETKGFTPKGGAGVLNHKESIEDLTTRQVTILALMGDGLTNADISTKVLLSESTVRQETIRIYRALAVSGRQEAVAKARALGLIPGLTFNAPPPSSSSSLEQLATV